MRKLPVSWMFMLAPLLVTACTVNAEDCQKNPTLECYSTGGGTSTGGTGGTTMGGGGTGGTGGSTTSMTGGGGTGGAPECMAAADCIAKNGDAGMCNEWTCPNGTCTLAPLAANTPCANGLMCDGQGSCKCDQSTAANCPVSSECFSPICDTNGTCGEEPLTGMPCDSMTGTCSDQGACLHPIASPCTTGAECESTFCADGLCCDAACDGKCMACVESVTGDPDGTCAPVPAGEVDPSNMECADMGGCSTVEGWCYCEDGTKNNGETDVDCGGPSCGATCTLGLVCKADGDCAGGKPCVDGFCCSGACDGLCMSCNQTEIPGLCSAIVWDEGSGGCTGGTDRCNAELMCLLKDGQNCTDPSQCASGICKADNKCGKCDSSNPCPAGYTCFLDLVCAPADQANGKPCVTDDMCTSNSCVDGVCCESACDGLCMACNIEYTGQPSGTCAPVLEGFDPQKECPTSGQPSIGKTTTCSGQMDPMDMTQSFCGINP